MKRILPYLTLLFLVTSALAQTLENPSFEEAGASPDVAAHWSRWGDWMNRETAWSPTVSGKAMMGYHHWQIEKPANSGIWQDVTGVKAGSRFTFAIQAWLDKVESGSVEKVELRMEVAHGSEQVQIASAEFTPKDIPSDGQWHKLSVTGTTPEANLRVLVVVTPAANAPRNGAAKFDDASLSAVP